MMINWEEESAKVSEIKAELIRLEALLSEKTEQLEKAKEERMCSLEAQEVLQRLAQAIQQQAHERLAEVVSSCLSIVFDHPYQFKINFERKRGKTEASLKFLRGSLEVDPMSACGGGMVDVAAFALRAACLMLHRPPLRRILVIDEGFKFVSSQYRDNVRTMLERMSTDLGIQIIQVTHIRELEAGLVVEL